MAIARRYEREEFVVNKSRLTVAEPASPVELANIENMLNLRFARWRKERRFHVEVNAKADVLEVTVLLANPDRSYYYPVEARILPRVQNVHPKQAMSFLVEYLEAYFEEYFAGDEDVYLPIDWTNYDYEGIEFQLRGQVKNLLLESLADKLLAGEQLEEATAAAGHPGSLH